jgi:hypothetical protein
MKLLLPLAFVCLVLMSCDTLKIVDVKLEITGDNLAAFSGYYETTSKGRVSIQGVVPKTETFQARKKYDVVAAQIVSASTGQMTARLIADGVTRDSATVTGLNTILLEWTPK